MPPRRRRILRIRVSLEQSHPEIWRTIDVAENMPLARLHDVLQAAFGWQNRHLHRFSEEDPDAVSRGIPRIGRRPRAWVDQWSLLEGGTESDEDEALTTVGEALREGGPIWYEYDLGDGWVHRIELVDRDVARLSERPATVVAGERRGPFEDSGGVHGYQEKLEVLRNPRHPEHAETTEWARWVAGPWGSLDPDDAGLAGAEAELDALFGEAAVDMSGLADSERGIEPESPIALFAAELPVPIRSNLRHHLATTGVLDRVTLDTASASELIRPYAWLLERVGTDGLTLTQAGWMPPVVVREGMAEFNWRDRWPTASDREIDTMPMQQLRESAERMRLIRKYRGKLEVVKRVGAIVGNPVALSEHVARMLLRQRMTEGQATASTLLVLGIADGSISGPREAEERVLRLLTELGYADADGQPLGMQWFYGLTAPVRDVLDTLGLWADARRERQPSAALRSFARAALR